jgi:hypothetical protein
MIAMLLGPLGAGDCERILETGLIQPVNAWSSLAYSVVGIAVAIYARSVHGRERSYRIVFGTLLTATGIGSFLYHGPQSAGAGFTHDITFLATLWFLILVHAGSALRRTGGVLWMLFGVAVATISVVLLIAPSSTNVITGLSVIALVGSDVSLHRNGRINGRLYATALVLFAGALVANLLGRTGVSTCDPASYLQFHGLWHVLSALALGVYFLATTGPRNQVPRP